MMRRRRRFTVLLALIGAALLAVPTGTAAGSAAPPDLGPRIANDECLVGPAARVPKWAPTLQEPSTLLPAEASRLDQQLQPGIANAQRDSARGRLGRITVSTWVHVISTDGTVAGGNVPDAQIAQQLQVLNDSFSSRTGGAPTVFRFRLAGVTRTVNPAWAQMEPDSAEELAAKSALRRGGPETLNLYVTQTPELLGWAYLPDGDVENTVLDGVVVLDGTLPDGYAVPYDEGDTATHEVGHWLALFHTFDNGCTRPGDYVLDTPYEAEPAFECPIGRDTCRQWGNDPVENFMDYSDDFCMHEFTGLQGLRMWAAWRTFRA